jgi:hypothetical protein
MTSQPICGATPLVMDVVITSVQHSLLPEMLSIISQYIDDVYDMNLTKILINEMAMNISQYPDPVSANGIDRICFIVINFMDLGCVMAEEAKMQPLIDMFDKMNRQPLVNVFDKMNRQPLVNVFDEMNRQPLTDVFDEMNRQSLHRDYQLTEAKSLLEIQKCHERYAKFEDDPLFTPTDMKHIINDTILYDRQIISHSWAFSFKHFMGHRTVHIALFTQMSRLPRVRLCEVRVVYEDGHVWIANDSTRLEDIPYSWRYEGLDEAMDGVTYHRLPIIETKPEDRTDNDWRQYIVIRIGWMLLLEWSGVSLADRENFWAGS